MKTIFDAFYRKIVHKEINDVLFMIMWRLLQGSALRLSRHANMAKLTRNLISLMRMWILWFWFDYNQNRKRRGKKSIKMLYVIWGQSFYKRCIIFFNNAHVRHWSFEKRNRSNSTLKVYAAQKYMWVHCKERGMYLWRHYKANGPWKD